MTKTPTVKPHWAMLATSYDDIECPLFPMFISPKLNGIRAGWFPGEGLFTREGKRIGPHVLPHIYRDLADIKIPIDGELFCKELSFQEIAGICAVARNMPHERCGKVKFHAFDIIGGNSQMTRQVQLISLLDNVTPIVECLSVQNSNEAQAKFLSYVEQGYEGAILRQTHAPYTPGRTVAVLKMKPWRTFPARIVNFTEGKGKYRNMLGAFVCKANLSGVTVEFKVSGGLLDTQRKAIWANKAKWRNQIITCKAQEFSESHTPLKPQIDTSLPI